LSDSSFPEIRVYAFKCGILRTETQNVLKDTRIGSALDVPVMFFLISHGEDWVAFDTGNNVAVASDPAGHWSTDFVKIWSPVMKDSEEFQAQIKKLGISPKDLRAVIISHGHLDHAGSLGNFFGTSIPIYFQKREYDEILTSLASGEWTGYIPGDYKYIHELNIKPIEGVFDVFGDQTVVAFPTPGHTPGHQSLVVKLGQRTLLLCGDASYTLENMSKAIPADRAWDFSQHVQMLHFFKVMSYLGVEIVPSHDPVYWRDKPLAPEMFSF
jgi:glyoxylase-like metal-dependent hydrolase (beta-lactamase superfamily II)